MTTSRYKPEYLNEVIELLKSYKNAAELPSDIFFDIARLVMDGEADDREKLNKLLHRAYTVMGLENGELVGLTSMDKDGNVGILVIKDGAPADKVARGLLRALDRRAEKREMTQLFVLRSEVGEEVFSLNGYEPFDNGSGGEDAVNEYQLVKVITPETLPAISPENAKTIILDPKKPIKIEGKVSAFPIVFFITWGFFAAMLVGLVISSIVNTGTLEDKFVPFILVFGGLFVISFAIFVAYLVRGAKLKKEVLSMRVTNAAVTGVNADSYYAHAGSDASEKYTDLTVWYEYFDENGVKRAGSFFKKYKGDGPYFYKGQELIVACEGAKNYLLCKYTIVNQGNENITEFGGGSEMTGFENLSSSTKKINPADYVPMQSNKIFYIIGGVLFAVFAFVVGFICVFSYLTSRQTMMSFWEAFKLNGLFLLFAALILGGLFLYYISVPVLANMKYKNILKTDVKFAEGKLACADKTYDSSNKNRFLCAFKDESGEIRYVKINGMHVKKLVTAGRTKVIVAYNAATAVVLRKKDEKLL